MHSPISTQEKKDYLHWFLDHYQLKKRESTWLLNYLCNHDEILANIHFVRDINLCPRSIVISSQCSNQTPFRFYKGHIMTSDADKAFHDIRLHQHKPLYVQLNYLRANQCPHFASVLEENPYTLNQKSDNYDSYLAEQFLNTILVEQKMISLRKAIDRSLDELDRTKFQKLVHELHMLQKIENK